MNELTPDARHAIEQALAAGKKIEAIKLYREATGAGLKDAKDAMDALEKELRATRPDLFVGRPAKAGCAASTLGVFFLLFLWLLVT